MNDLPYLVVGAFFGIILYKSEAISWFRIQEMFRFQSFHMYGLLFSAVFTGAIALQILRRFGITLERRPYQHGVLLGGILFGCGWALTGACPGPLYVLVGSGTTVMIVSILS